MSSYFCFFSQFGGSPDWLNFSQISTYFAAHSLKYREARETPQRLRQSSFRKSINSFSSTTLQSSAPRFLNWVIKQRKTVRLRSISKNHYYMIRLHLVLMFCEYIFMFFLNLEAVPTDWILVKFRHISWHSPFFNAVKHGKTPQRLRQSFFRKSINSFSPQPSGLSWVIWQVGFRLLYLLLCNDLRNSLCTLWLLNTMQQNLRRIAQYCFHVGRCTSSCSCVRILSSRNVHPINTLTETSCTKFILKKNFNVSKR